MFQEQTADVAQPGSFPDAVAEANHRIANSLSLVSALARKQLAGLISRGESLSRDEVRVLLTELTARLDAVGRLHRMLSSAPPQVPVDVGAYLQQVVSEVVASVAKPDTFVLHFACQLGCSVPAERAMQLGLMVVELVVNSVKHAHPTGVVGRIEIRCRRDPHAVVVTVSDDGVGMPEDFSPSDSRHAGIRLIHSLAHQIGARVSFDSGSLGLRCEITAPAATAVKAAN
jgi:two-component sensor histidine kinase